MYLLEDNKSLVDFFVAAFGKERGEMETALAWCGWRWSEQGDRITHEEFFGNGTVKKTFRLGEEVDTTSQFSEGTEVNSPHVFVSLKVRLSTSRRAWLPATSRGPTPW